MEAESIPTTEEEILAAVQLALEMAPSELPPDLPTRPDLLGAPGWYPFELRAWELGEGIRQGLVRSPRLKTRAVVQEALLAVVERRSLRRGRQPFVLNLGHFAASAMAHRLAPFLADADIDGQVIDALLRMRAGGFAAQVAPLSTSNRAWVRRLARRYLDRFAPTA